MAVSSCDIVVLPCHPSRVHCELLEGGVEPFGKDPFDVVPIAADRVFAPALPDKMRLQISLASLPEGDVCL